MGPCRSHRAFGGTLLGRVVTIVSSVRRWQFVGRDVARLACGWRIWSILESQLQLDD
jgi:hypothetical protein